MLEQCLIPSIKRFLSFSFYQCFVDSFTCFVGSLPDIVSSVSIEYVLPISIPLNVLTVAHSQSVNSSIVF
jgi:hypothetical protein